MALILELVNYQGNAPAAPTTMVFGARGGTLGRAPECSWILPDPQKYISGIHAVICHENGIYYLADTSTNGVFINDTEEPVGKSRKVPLRDGDLLYIGEYQISVCVTEEQDNTPHPSSDKCSVEYDDLLANNQKRDDSINQASRRHVSYLDDFGDQRGDSEITQDHEIIDRLTEDQGARPKDVSILSRLDQPQQENTSDWAQAPLTDKPGLRESLTVKVYEQNTPVPSSKGQLILDEKLQKAAVKQQGSENRNLGDWHDPIFTADSESTEAAGIERSPARKAASSKVMDELVPSEVFNKAPINRPVQETSSESESSRVMKAFLKGLGLKKAVSSTQDPVETMELIGVCFRELIQGVMDILMVRATLKKEFRMTATTVHPIENNPLKFAMSVDEALPYLLFKHSSGFLPPLEAIREGIQDVQDHHWAIMVAMQAAFEDLLKQFDPELLEECFAKDSKLGSLRKVNKMFRNWDSYCEYYESLTKDAHSSFERLFGERFVHAYEDQIQRLSKVKKSPK